MTSWLVVFGVLAIASGATPPQIPLTPGQAATEVVAEVRVHGNYRTPDAEVLRLAGLAPGQSIDAFTLPAVEKRLRQSGRFDAVEIRKRYRSLSESGDVVVILIVREHEIPDEGPGALRPIRKFMHTGMFLPILNYTDGYGFTYGARFSFVNTLGRDSRVSVPLTWGGTKRAAVELDKNIRGEFFDHLSGGISISRRENPYYRADDDRQEVWAAASRQVAKIVRVGLHGGFADVGFLGLDDRLATYGADVTLDTRTDPVFPRDAVFASVGWEGLDPHEYPNVNRFRAEVRGYKGIVRQSVLSLRWQYGHADRSLPPYEEYLLGGASNLRGYRAGSFAGDNLMAASVELRVPLSSPLGVTKFGINIFGDTGTVWDYDTQLGKARFEEGFGAGAFLLASLFKLNLEVGFRTDGGARLHFTTGLQF
jgi:outer membrane protein assembly factor BamA